MIAIRKVFYILTLWTARTFNGAAVHAIECSSSPKVSHVRGTTFQQETVLTFIGVGTALIAGRRGGGGGGGVAQRHIIHGFHPYMVIDDTM